MKALIVQLIFIILSITINNNIYASDSPLWVELQNNWYTSDNAEIKDYNSYIENKSNLYKVDIFNVLKQYEKSIEGESIRVYRKIKKIDNIIELFLYVRSVIPLISVELNGRNLDFAKPSWNEYLFQIDYSFWEENNLLTLSIPSLKDLPKEDLVPAVFIVKESNINRIRNIIVQVPDEQNGNLKEILLIGPMLLKKLNNKEYELFSKNPEFYNFNENTFWRTVVPSGSNFLLQNSYGHKLAYKFYFQFQGETRKNIALSIGVINGADEIYINNKLIGQTGTPGILSKSYYDKKRNYSIPASVLKEKEVNAALIITHGISEYASGELLSNNIRLTEFDSFSNYFDTKEILYLLSIVILIVSSLITMKIFIIREYKKEYLFLTLFFLDLALYLFFNSQIEYLIADSFLLRIKAEFISLFLLMPFITLFFRFYYNSKFSIFEKIMNALLYLNLISQFILLFISIVSNDISLYHNSLKYFYITCAISFLYIFFFTVRDVFYNFRITFQ